MSFGADWTCSCGWANLDIRPKCRNCGATNPDYVPPARKAPLAKPASSPALQPDVVSEPPAPRGSGCSGEDVVREALEAAFDFLGGVDGAIEIRDKLLAALSQSTAGRVGEARKEIIRLMREEFDPKPSNYGGPVWDDDAEAVADKIIALFASLDATERR